MRSVKPVLMAILLLWPAVPSAASIFQVNEWSLDTGVFGTPPNFGAASIATVSNPLQTTSSWNSAPSSAISQYDFAWTDTAGDFLIQSTQQAADTDPTLLLTISSSIMILQANQDLLFSYDIACDYNLPIDDMQVVCSLGVMNNAPPNEGYVDAYVVDSTHSDWPASASFHQSGQVILPAGNEYYIASLLRLAVGGPPSNGIATIDGYIHFTLQEVPEPAAIFPLAFVIVLRRRNRRAH